MRHFIVGFNVNEAQSYAMRFKHEHRGDHVRVLSVQQVQYGALRGLAGEGVEVIIMPRAWEHREAVTLARYVDDLELRGVKVTTAKDAD